MQSSPVMLFPCRLILSSVAISVSLSGKMEKLLSARLMKVRCSMPATVSGSLVRTFPCRSSSATRFKDMGGRGRRGGGVTSTACDVLCSLSSQNVLSCLISYLLAQRRWKRICQRGPSSCCEPKWWNGCCARHCSGPWRHRLGRKRACSLTDLHREKKWWLLPFTQQQYVSNLQTDKYCVSINSSKIYLAVFYLILTLFVYSFNRQWSHPFLQITNKT